jgi:glycosyltransferase involved in cell wall biosynthesis
MIPKHPFSVVIICNNESRTIRNCILSAQRVSDDVVVVDSGSTDGTQEIARSVGARVFDYEWKGYSANKNFGNEQAKHDWIISLDGDEVMNEELIHILHNLIPQARHVYRLNSLVNFGGQWIRHSGWFPVWKHRIFNRKEVSWNQALVHEDLSPLEGMTIVSLKGLLHHYSFKDIEDHQERTERYSQLRVREWLESGKGPGLLKRLFGPSFRWFKTYFLKRGFLDGKMGWYISCSDARMIRRQIQLYDRIKSEQ